VSGAGSPYRWAILAVCVAGLTGSFATAFAACAVFEVVALAIGAFARETGRRAAV